MVKTGKTVHCRHAERANPKQSRGESASLSEGENEGCKVQLQSGWEILGFGAGSSPSQAGPGRAVQTWSDRAPLRCRNASGQKAKMELAEAKDIAALMLAEGMYPKKIKAGNWSTLARDRAALNIQRCCATMALVFFFRTPHGLEFELSLEIAGPLGLTATVKCTVGIVTVRFWLAPILPCHRFHFHARQETSPQLSASFPFPSLPSARDGRSRELTSISLHPFSLRFACATTQSQQHVASDIHWKLRLPRNSQPRRAGC
jgi:hypothetical protein